jgi:hypothetical protein
MPTTQEEKPAKPRARNRKAESRSSKGGQKRVEARVEVDPVHPTIAETDDVAVEVAPLVITEPVVAVDVAPAVTSEPAVAMEQAVTLEQAETMEKLEATVLSGEVLPPEVIQPTSQADGFQAIALAYGDYTKKSWLNGRFMMERLIAVRSFDEAVEIQGEFAKQAYATFSPTRKRSACSMASGPSSCFGRLKSSRPNGPASGAKCDASIAIAT